MSNITAKARELRKLLEYVTETLDDQTALSVATFVERWKPDTSYEVAAGNRPLGRRLCGSVLTKSIVVLLMTRFRTMRISRCIKTFIIPRMEFSICV